MTKQNNDEFAQTSQQSKVAAFHKQAHNFRDAHKAVIIFAYLWVQHRQAHRCIDVPGYRGALWTLLVLFHCSYSFFLICSLFAHGIFSLSFPFYSPLSPSLTHSITVSSSLSHTLFVSALSHSRFSTFPHLRSVLLCIFGPSAPPFLLVHSGLCVVFLKGLSELSKRCFGLTSVVLTPSVRVTGHAFVSASKEHTHSFTYIYWHTHTAGEESLLKYSILKYHFDVFVLYFLIFSCYFILLLMYYYE